ncbi:MAG: flagellar basal body P-ring formation chaperone FlgA [Burkholderiales bacterium]|nr:flagellar basal body P-ring formation protein FlgA [Burkholderiales bacterium]MCA3160266.1 flagellar basal body P-ring formation protein FlgA [Burkholderiales bacterium]MCA3172720.1 flagellar basal body P-ring formation protein FlgA [Burkholderiales bacterium]
MCFCSPGLFAMPTDQIEKFVTTQLALSPTSSNTRVEISAGQLDTRMKLRPCNDLTPFLPQGTRLWGRAYIGIRCNERPVWTAFIPIDVSIFTNIPVANRLLVAGETVDIDDVTLEERDITKLGANPVTSIEQVQGRVLTRGFSPGQALALSAFRSVPVIKSGDIVKVVVHGNGFSIATDGVALGQAETGQPVRIRLDNGKMLQGIAQSGRRVEVKL